MEQADHDPNLPLFNRAISGQYPPGSVFKTIVAAGGLPEGTITARSRLGDGFDGSNDGVIWLPNEYFPWDRSMAQPFVSWNAKLGFGHGMITVRDALAVSDDIFFYELRRLSGSLRRSRIEAGSGIPARALASTR